jgi:hypothetical protein
MTQSSFYADGEVLDAAVVESNDVPASTSPTLAPSGFYPDGTVYEALADSDTVLAQITADLAASLAAKTAAEAAAANADVDAAAAHQAYLDAVALLATSLLKANNLSDLTNVAQAKINLSLVKGDVGLGNVDNTSDANKPVSTAQQTALNLKANLASPTLTGVPAAPTATAGTNTTQLATTAFVEAARVILAAADALKAPLASPALTGTPTAPTPTASDNSTKLATTAYVDGPDATLAAGLLLRAPLASPALTGTPTAPTASAGTNTTQLATTAFVEAARVILAAADALKAPLASPALTGTPTAPTASAGTNTTQLATTAYVIANAAPPTSYVENEILYASKFSFSNATLTKVMELTLPTIGEWDVSATWGFETGAGCVATEYHCQLSETDVAGGIISAPNKGGSVGLHVNFVAGQGQIFSAGPRRFVTTIINTKAYMLCYSSFSGGAATQTVWGHVRARKVG